ncbi:maleylacetate reductase [Caballeronia sordidicola]|uniref:maleylacetate reductase n=1 Tax=Caballeronia sordidicola TaxID=196367 RepID=A0A226WLP6_CABSO|nr:maleylacetate reductase [Caballeronia sordidicola]OXC72033.1 Alcohol dehydrogenase [Caballeronia sordidicola]
MQNFIFSGQPSRIVFGIGALSHLEREIDLLGAKRALVLCTPGQISEAEAVSDLLGQRAAGLYARAVMHVPMETALEAIQIARRIGADCAVAIGGGSTTGLGKAIALDSGLPIIAIPTTYAGSEMTPIYGITENGIKKTGKDPRVAPKTIIYDPNLTCTLPVGLSITSGVNAIAHAAEGLYARDGNPVMEIMAEEGIRALGHALPLIREDSSSMAARDEALYGAWLCGSVLGNVGMALHHKLCHTLGGSFNLPHAEVHTVILSQAIAFNAAAAPRAMARITRALGVSPTTSAASALFDLALENGAPVSLEEIGMKRCELDEAAEIVVSNPYWNPRPAARENKPEIYELLQRAFEGVRPD